MARFRARRSDFYMMGGTLLLSLGVLLGALLATRVVSDIVQASVETHADYLVLAAVPPVPLPPARATAQRIAALTTSSPPQNPARLVFLAQVTAAPTAAPLPQIPVRLAIPAIDLNSSVIGVEAQKVRLAGGQERWKWTVADYAVGHHISSGKPGEGRNIVLTGHNNTRGEVFRYLPNLKIGDSVIIFSADREHYYSVAERVIVPYRRDRVNAERTIKAYSAPTPGERVTLISCYPYLTNADRIIIVAKPAEVDQGSLHES